ncbi:MAG TPA: hypothetical protein VK897_26560 [Anaerolineales bacterium]|nr:hypothetical protein [Anaerolineales bacterium]
MELETLLRILAKKWRIIVPIFVITFLATVLFTMKEPRIYEARATYVAKLSSIITDNRDFAAVINILSSRIEIATTYAQVANSQIMKQTVGEKLGLSPATLRSLSVNSRLIPGTNIIEITVQGTDPLLAKDFTNALGASTIEYVKGLYETFTLAPLDEARAPARPIYPKVSLNLLLGAVAGLVLGISIALLTYYFQSWGKKAAENVAEVEPSVADPVAEEVSTTQLRQEMLNLQTQFLATQQTLTEIQTALRRMKLYAKDIRSSVHDVRHHLEVHHNGNGKAATGHTKRDKKEHTEQSS